MKGLELSREFYLSFGKAMIENQFGQIKNKIAVGLFGSGSECYGFDDEISRDHDFEPGFCIVLPSEEEVDRKTAFALERAYSKLPKTFMGVNRGNLSPVGGNRHGVIRSSDFFTDKVGRADGLISGYEWFTVPETFLAEATNGEVFFDGSGVFTSIREYLSSYPKDVRLKKLAGNLLLASQTGQYNYPRCIKRGERAGAALCVNQFVDKIMSVVFLLNDKYRPYYKWAFRAYSQLEKLSSLYDALEFLITTDNADENAGIKINVIEDIALAVSEELKNQEITKATCIDLEKHAYSVNDHISDPELRNQNVLMSV
ncbi:MAG: DUF4037 domain-containing protein [Clostridia bacterium]|nr:DUF4037 domain-containing protein [Clostridia bacterium]